MTLDQYLTRVTEQVGKYGPDIMGLSLLHGMFGAGGFQIGFSTPDGDVHITVDELKREFPGEPFDVVLAHYRDRLRTAVEEGKKRWAASR